MTIQELGSLGELIGSVATLATLVYLAIQIRQNTAQMRDVSAAARLGAVEHTVETFSRHRSFLVPEGNAEIYAKGLESYAQLGVAERIRFCAIIEEYFFAYFAMFERTRHGVYETARWSRTARVAGSLLDQQGASAWWQDRQHLFPAEFIEEIEKIRGELAAGGD